MTILTGCLFCLPFLQKSTVGQIKTESEATISDDSAPVTYRPEIGQPHPDFVLPKIADGKPLKLSDFRGKKVLLVHFASW